MLKIAFLLVTLWGLAYARNVAEADDPELFAISKDVNQLRFLYVQSLDNVVEIDFNNRNTLEGANIRADLPLIVTIDGFLSNTTSPLTTLLRESYANRGTDNLIVLDYSELSGSKANVGNPILMAAAYLTVLGNVDPIGQRLAAFLELVAETKGIPLSQVTIVGGSLGAHIGGAAGTALRKKYGSAKIGRIAGLDPAGPFFSMQISKDKRLSRDDAEFVDIYHSNRGQLGDSDQDTGDINVYINGGNNQPGCAEADKAGSGVCSHGYSFRLFNLAFSQDITACSCSGSDCTCNTCRYDCPNPISVGPDCPTNARGRYHVGTDHIF